ncbi:MAG: ChbG/HpnK family deacetylase [Parasporobacterium sp.]|nr:ChbG/HpnK family deacetylase [Parasporobacterium sp.]
MILFHADDYGINRIQSQKILTCRSRGSLNSVSLLVTSPEAVQCVSLLPPDIRCRLHLNFREGPCLSEPSEIRMLVDEKGYFRLSFGGMLFWSVLRRKRLKTQLKKEIRSQILRMRELMGPDIPMRIDSHGHYHMIPAVWDALFETCGDLKIGIQELRVPAEPFGPILKDPYLLRKAPVSGIVKNLVMHLLYACDRIAGKQPKDFDFKKNVPLFFGMIFTTRMTQVPVGRLLPSFQRLAAASGRDLELMFHPGGLSEKDVLWDERFREFHTSPDRCREARTLCTIFPEKERSTDNYEQ